MASELPQHRALLETADEIRIDRIDESRDGVPQLLDPGIALGRRIKSGQDQSARAVRIVYGEALSGVAAHRVSDNDSGFDPKRIHEGCQIGGKVGRAVASHGAVGVAVTALGNRDCTDRSWQKRLNPLERSP
jgi:hypothetical protein